MHRNLFLVTLILFNRYRKITAKWKIKCEKVRKTLEFLSPHNPEVVGSSPASATRKEKVIPIGMAFSFLFCMVQDENPSKCNSPADCCSNQFKNWLQPQFNRVLPPQPDRVVVTDFVTTIFLLYPLFLRNQLLKRVLRLSR